MEHLPERIAATTIIISVLTIIFAIFIEDFNIISMKFKDKIVTCSTLICVTIVALCMLWILWA